MNFLRNLFKSGKGAKSVENNDGVAYEAKSEREKIKEATAVFNSMPEINPPQKDFKIDVDPDEAFNKICNEMEENSRKHNMKTVLTYGFIKANKYEELATLSNSEKFDVLSYGYFSQKAHEYLKNNELEKALHIFWQNIYDNGTNSKGNYEEVLMILNKLKRTNEELIIAKIYKRVLREKELGTEKQIEAIDKRINRLEKQLYKAKS